MKHARKILGAAVVAGAVALPAATAQAATWNVGAGPGASIASQFPENSTDNAYYPKHLRVRVGDKAKFTINGFHNVWFPKSGEAPPPFAAPDLNQPIAGVVDAAGAPLWFNGSPGVYVEPRLLSNQGNAKVNGKAVDASAIPTGPGEPDPYTVSFKSKGTYSYYCVIHPGMKGSVTVVGKDQRVPTKKAVNAAIAKQGRQAVRQATALDAVRPPALTVQVGSDNAHVAVLKFFPAEATVPVGGTVTFQMPARTTEIHNVAFGPLDYLRGITDILPGPTGVQFNPMIVYPSDPGPLNLNGTNHGNGWINTGVLDPDPATVFPSSAAVTFTKAGSYTFICNIHPFMQGTITVQ